MENALVAYKEGHDFGMGIKSSTGGRMQLGATGAVTQIAGGSGGSGSFQMTRIQTTSELESHLGISADASGGVGLFSASDRFNFAKDCKVQTTSITLLLHCTRQFGFRQIAEPSLTQSAAALVSEGRADLFADRFGDCFVVGLETGGQFFGVIRIDTKNDESRQSIENSLSGSYGPFSADVAVKVSDAMKSTQSHAEVYLYYEGGDVKTKPQTPQQLFDAANEWSNTLAAQPKPYASLLLPYVVANGPEPPNKEDLAHQHDILVRCAKLRSQTFDRLNLVDYINDSAHRGEFVFDSQGPDLGLLMADLSRDLDIISEAASFAIDHPKEALEPEPYARTKKGLENYTLRLLPSNMPKHLGANNVTVPDFRKATSQDEANQLAAANHLTLHWIENPGANPWHIESQDPPVGASVNAGATVVVVSMPPIFHRLNKMLLVQNNRFAVIR